MLSIVHIYFIYGLGPSRGSQKLLLFRLLISLSLPEKVAEVMHRGYSKLPLQFNRRISSGGRRF